VSLFSCARKKSAAGATGDAAGDDPLAGIDEARMEYAMNELADEMALLESEEGDSQQAAATFRKFAAMTGMRFNSAVQEALNRLESGADPDQVEAEFGDALNEGNPFAEEGGSLRDLWRKLRNEPHKDPTLYDFPA